MRVFVTRCARSCPPPTCSPRRPGLTATTSSWPARISTRCWPGTGHQRQRLERRFHPRGGRADRPCASAEHGSLRVVGRRGERARRLDELRQRPEPGAEGPHALYLNFDMVGSPNYIFMTQDADQSSFLRLRRASTFLTARSRSRIFESFYTLRGEPYDDAAFDGQRLPGVHQQRHPGRWPLHRRGGSEDRRAAVDLGRHRGCAVRPVLPRGLRHLRQQQRPCACHQRRSDRVRDADVRVLDGVGQRRAGQVGPGQLQIPAPAGSEGTCPVNPPLPESCP